MFEIFQGVILKSDCRLIIRFHDDKGAMQAELITHNIYGLLVHAEGGTTMYVPWTSVRTVELLDILDDSSGE